MGNRKSQCIMSRLPVLAVLCYDRHRQLPAPGDCSDLRANSVSVGIKRFTSTILK
jgi:hypothetical protein